MSIASEAFKDFMVPMTMPVRSCSDLPEETSITISICLPGVCLKSIFNWRPMIAGFRGTDFLTNHGPSSREKIILTTSFRSSADIVRNRCQSRACGLSTSPSRRSQAAFGSRAPTMIHWYGGRTQFTTSRNLSSPRRRNAAGQKSGCSETSRTGPVSPIKTKSRCTKSNIEQGAGTFFLSCKYVAPRTSKQAGGTQVQECCPAPLAKAAARRRKPAPRASLAAESSAPSSAATSSMLPVSPTSSLGCEGLLASGSTSSSSGGNGRSPSVAARRLRREGVAMLPSCKTVSSSPPL
mmetsp:Transcript_14509/g.41714  ORF Transcript_14509/g.41714 Transcript_14509/m.41714 type:complete len:294 (+) Transcript_14509:448-1329(+)